MPKIPRLPLSRLIALLGASFALAHAALIPTEWQHRQTVVVPAAGVVHVDLPAPTFDAAEAQQQDLRVLDPAGREVALLLDCPPLPSARTLRPASFDVRLEPGETIVTLATGTREPLASVALETPHPFFLRPARLEISNDDGANWTVLDEGLPLFRQWGAEKLQLPLKGRTATHVRITVAGPRAAGLPFTGASLHLDAGPAPALVPVGAHIARREEFANETVLTLELDGRHVPLAAMEIDTGDTVFMRRVSVTVREVQGLTASERLVGEGTIYRVALDGAPARTQLELPLNYTPLTRELLVHIHNGDSPPLAIERVNLKRRPFSLLFRAAAAGNYSLLTGNPQATAPRYDLAAFAGELRSASAVSVTPGPLEDMPDYRPRSSLAEPPLADVPLAGAPLDTKEWAFRQSVSIDRAGVQELELNLTALARARSDFGDLRLLRDGNQIPYLLEQPALARSLALTATIVPDPKRPSVSVWQVKLPQPGLPLRRLVLTTKAPLFERQFRLYEKIRRSDSSTSESTLANGNWSRTPEPGVPESRVFELADRLRTDTLWIETDNGDNPAIALGPVQAAYPVVRLVFKVAETDGFSLAYGNKAVGAPRYDLNLVARKLLTAKRATARLEADTPAPPERKNPLVGLNGGVVFWAALALVVVVLLVAVAKLLPKPPAG